MGSPGSLVSYLGGGSSAPTLISTSAHHGLSLGNPWQMLLCDTECTVPTCQI